MRHMPRLQRKSLSRPGRRPDVHTRACRCRQSRRDSVARFTWEPGWRWSKDVKPVVETTTCENRHVGYVLRARCHVQMDDGTDIEIRPGDVYEIPPGHDAWVAGDEHVRHVEVASAAVFGAQAGREREHAGDDPVHRHRRFDRAAEPDRGRGVAAGRRSPTTSVMRAELDRCRGREMGDDRRRLPRPVRRGGAGRPVRPGDDRGVRDAGSRDPGGPAHRRGGDRGRSGSRAGRARGCACLGARWALARSCVSSTTRDLLDGSGPVVRQPRRPRAQGSHRSADDLRARGAVRSAAVGPQSSRRSTIVAMPWPTPMHIVARP